MKRFWHDVDIERDAGGWGILLDNRPVRTPARARLAMPTEELARNIADEWRQVDGKVDPRTMPLTGLANAAIDRVAPDRQAFATGISRYAQADLACYRAQSPRELVARQDEEWDGLIAWARGYFGVDFVTTSELMHVDQPSATVERLGQAVFSLDSFRLAGLSILVTIGGSLIAGLAILERAIGTEACWSAVSLDERWQLERWGHDPDAEAALANRRRDFFAAARFLRLLD